jgi:hypothetical protein
MSKYDRSEDTVRFSFLLPPGIEEVMMADVTHKHVSPRINLIVDYFITTETDPTH